MLVLLLFILPGKTEKVRLDCRNLFYSTCDSLQVAVNYHISALLKQASATYVLISITIINKTDAMLKNVRIVATDEGSALPEDLDQQRWWTSIKQSLKMPFLGGHSDIELTPDEVKTDYVMLRCNGGETDFEKLAIRHGHEQQ